MTLNLGEKMKIYPQVLTFFIKRNLVILRCFDDDGKGMDKIEKRICRACKAIVLMPNKYANL